MLARLMSFLLLATTPDAGPGAAIPDITAGLPWQFDQPETMPSRSPQSARPPARDPFWGAAGALSWSWKSANPYLKDGSRKHFLHVYLTRFDYGNGASAMRALTRFLEKADPEMGFSYAWDYVVADERYLWHLYAPCPWTRAYFDRLVSNLTRNVLTGHSTGKGTAVYCTCGSGCRRQ